jgi:hypothetical protein
MALPLLPDSLRKSKRGLRQQVAHWRWLGNSISIR